MDSCEKAPKIQTVILQQLKLNEFLLIVTSLEHSIEFESLLPVFFEFLAAHNQQKLWW